MFASTSHSLGCRQIASPFSAISVYIPTIQSPRYSAFCPRGEQSEIVWIIGGGKVCVHVQSMWQTKGVWGYAPPGNFDFGPFVSGI